MIEIIPMSPAHIDAVAGLEAVCFTDPWPANSFVESLACPDTRFFVAVRNDTPSLVGYGGLRNCAGESLTLVGYGGLRNCAGEGEIMNLAVHPALRGLGVGRALMEALLKAAEADGISRLFLEVRKSNSPAIALYESLAFKPIAVRHGYYTNPKEDAVIYVRRSEGNGVGAKEPRLSRFDPDAPDMLA